MLGCMLLELTAASARFSNLDNKHTTLRRLFYAALVRRRLFYAVHVRRRLFYAEQTQNTYGVVYSVPYHFKH